MSDPESLQLYLLSIFDESKDGRIADTRTLSFEGANIEYETIKAALYALADRQMVVPTQHDHITYDLTPEGSSLALEGSHEARVYGALPAFVTGPEGEGLTPKEIVEKVGEASAKVGQGKAMKNGWVEKRGEKFYRKVASITDITSVQLASLSTSNPLSDLKVLADLKKRKLVLPRKTLYFSIEKGDKFGTKIEKLETDLTADMLASGAWKTSPFKAYNYSAAGAVPKGGALHPLMKVREEFRSIFFEMGFSEMPTNKFVETSFWNFDALFVPQQHPARELQDTFYIKDPPSSDEHPPAYLERVRQVHQDGGFGSIGYRYPWKPTEANRLVLRTHTTAISTALLYELAQSCLPSSERDVPGQEGAGGFRPAKLFSIDRVFRNEAVDATHLAEFHQVEGVVADKNLTLGDLIGFMEKYFNKMGVYDLRFKPAYNPYTEPSLEIFSFHKGLNKWVEVGNSGLFRPEMLQPMGFPEDVRVLGFGLSLERPTMIKYGVNNIRELVGHKLSLDWVEKQPAVRF
uniref:phenylalanine--tRNA ligase n=1 Tax=Bartheletia paradoxa TaxID=669517 RepID=A0A2D0XHW2_9BASI|nr:hypothetical protein SPAR05340 [Bartheletia paradoxa]